jgi:hypothetical protein
VRVEPSFNNILRIIAGVLVAFFAADLVEIRWKCKSCGSVFLAMGSQVTGHILDQGFPVEPLPPKEIDGDLTKGEGRKT